MSGAWEERFIREPSAGALDSLPCAIQAAWAFSRRDEDWGVPSGCDRNEGWVPAPALLDTEGTER